MFRLWQVLYICLIIYSLNGLAKDERSWYNQEVTISDWRNVGVVDYSTNAIVSAYYNFLNGNEYNTNYLRDGYMEKFREDMYSGDTVTLGLDYYALTGVSYPIVEAYFGMDFLKRIYPYLASGQVVRIKIWYNEFIYYESY